MVNDEQNGGWLTPKELDIAYEFGHDVPGFISGERLPPSADAITTGRVSAALSGMVKEIARLRDIVDQVDEVLVVNWVGPRVDGDYRKALNDLIGFNLEVDRYFAKEEASGKTVTVDVPPEFQGRENKPLGLVDRLSSIPVPIKTCEYLPKDMAAIKGADGSIAMLNLETGKIVMTCPGELTSSIDWKIKGEEATNE